MQSYGLAASVRDGGRRPHCRLRPVNPRRTVLALFVAQLLVLPAWALEAVPDEPVAAPDTAAAVDAPGQAIEAR